MLRLHYYPNTCALAVHVALEEAAADYTLELVNFETHQQSSTDFLALNPLGRVPTLETDRGTITEVPAILGYIAASWPSAALAPADPFLRARMMAFTAYIASTVHVTFAHYYRPYRWADDPACKSAISSRARTTYVDDMGIIERNLLTGPWVMGSQYTIADPYLYVMARWLFRADLDISLFPRIAQHLKMMDERPAVQRALEQEGLASHSG